MAKSGICRAGLVACAVLAMLAGACGSPLESKGNKPPVISSLEAEHANVYPRGSSNIECVASDPEGDQLSFKWSTTGGSLSNAVSIATWESPNIYGDYHIMVFVTDWNGDSTQATLTLSVIPRPSGNGCCGR